MRNAWLFHLLPVVGIVVFLWTVVAQRCASGRSALGQQKPRLRPGRSNSTRPRAPASLTEPPHTTELAPPCKSRFSASRSRPGVPCLPPLERYPYSTMSSVRTALGRRVESAIRPDIPETICGSFEKVEDATICVKALTEADAIGDERSTGLSFSIAPRDHYGEYLSNKYGLATVSMNCRAQNSTAQEGVGKGKCAQTSPAEECYEAEHKVNKACLGPIAKQRWKTPYDYQTFKPQLTGRRPLSVHLSIDTPGAEWSTLDQLLKLTPQLLNTVRTLHMSVDLEAIWEDDYPWVLQGRMETLQRIHERVVTLERLRGHFRVAGNTLEYDREQFKMPDNCTHGMWCTEPNVHSMQNPLTKFSVTYVNLRLVESLNGGAEADSGVA
mmetsp:Transcript_71147/g.203991  ORF Transcript_71147/g.203991 Transcript_71147/m.203991 type:complete len:383 (+) Transcript_71147:74-1222(+)